MRVLFGFVALASLGCGGEVIGRESSPVRSGAEAVLLRTSSGLPGARMLVAKQGEAAQLECGRTFYPHVAVLRGSWAHRGGQNEIAAGVTTRLPAGTVIELEGPLSACNGEYVSQALAYPPGGR